MKEMYILYRLENEVCDDSYVSIILATKDLEKAENKLKELLAENKEILKNEYGFSDDKINSTITQIEDDIGFYKFIIDREDIVTTYKIETVEVV